MTELRWRRLQNQHMKDVNYDLSRNGYILSSGSPTNAVYYKHKAGLDRRRTLVIALEDERLVSLEVQIEFTNPADPWKPKIYNRKII